MLGLLWLIPVLPCAGFLVLALVGPRLRRVGVASVGVGAVGLPTLLALLVGSHFIAADHGSRTRRDVIERALERLTD